MLYDIFWVIWGLGILLVLTYGIALFVGAPYLPTLKKTQDEALDLINLKKNQLLIDLGCGDGGVLVKAAMRGLRAEGYEINPFLFAFAWLRTRRFGRRVKVRYGNFWHSDISKADGVFVFLITHYMNKLDDFLSKGAHKDLKVVSHGFEIPGRKAIKKRGALFLYNYPKS